jgi:hypothetical protein
VAAGSITIMAMLARFHGRFSQSGRSPLVELDPRLLTGPIIKSSEDSRRAYLRNYADTRQAPRAGRTMSEDAFDAAVSALAMAGASKKLKALRQSTGRVERLEGRIWYPTK